MADRMLYRVYRRIGTRSRKYMGMVAVPLDIFEAENRAFEMAKELWGAGPYQHGSDYEIESAGLG